jgi:hypothetical protein
MRYDIKVVPHRGPQLRPPALVLLPSRSLSISLASALASVVSPVLPRAGDTHVPACVDTPGGRPLARASCPGAPGCRNSRTFSVPSAFSRSRGAYVLASYRPRVLIFDPQTVPLAIPTDTRPPRLLACRRPSMSDFWIVLFRLRCRWTGSHRWLAGARLLKGRLLS